MSGISVFRVIDKLEGAVRKSSRVPLTNYVIMDSEKLLGLLEKTRASLPEEMKQARWVNKENQRILAEAQAKAEGIVQEAKEEAARLVSTSEIMRQAREQAGELSRKAEEAARALRARADQYAREVLTGIETELGRILNLVEKARVQVALQEGPTLDGEGAAKPQVEQQILIG